ncbi:phosphatidylglycerophosphatase A family protein [Ramlibacter sp.]|uniref:phosphatidylglycerophosphatase A family protein n=1 Tax=Ramlibacter sp. TaxID=1917967 RepID=UPI003D0AD58B
MLSHPAHIVALGFGSGLARFAPGTCGTLWAWVAYLAMQRWLSPSTIGWVIVASIAIGWWACMVTAKNMKVLDPVHIVWDEVVSFWIVLWLLMPATWDAQLAAFVLFRFLDAVKPGPIAWADSLFHSFGWRGAFGILFDDLMAAFCTLFLIAAWRFL